jgi:hypothetical protein
LLYPGYSAWDFRETPRAEFLVKTGLFEWESLLQCEVCSNKVHIFLRISFKNMGNRKDTRYNRRHYNRRTVYIISMHRFSNRGSRTPETRNRRSPSSPEFLNHSFIQAQFRQIGKISYRCFQTYFAIFCNCTGTSYSLVWV